MASGKLLATQLALVAKNSPANGRDKRCRFDSWVRKIPWRRKWQAIPVFLPEDLMDGEAWWAAVCRVANSRTQLKWLSTHALLKNFKFGVVLFFCFSLWDFFFLLVVKLCACYWNIKNIVSVRCGGRFPLFLHSFRACPFACGLFHSSVHSFSARSRHSPPCLSIRTWSSNSLLYVNYISRKWEDLFKKERKLAKHLQQLVFHWISAMYGALF